MKNSQVIEKFVANKSFDGRAQNVTAINSKLFSYSTCIAQWNGDTLIVNETKYSPTTSKHQFYLMAAIKKYNVKTKSVTNVRIGSWALIK